MATVLQDVLRRFKFPRKCFEVLHVSLWVSSYAPALPFAFCLSRGWSGCQPGLLPRSQPFLDSTCPGSETWAEVRHSLSCLDEFLINLHNIYIVFVFISCCHLCRANVSFWWCQVECVYDLVYQLLVHTLTLCLARSICNSLPKELSADSTVIAQLAQPAEESIRSTVERNMLEKKEYARNLPCKIVIILHNTTN
jgi:hypothetical protein